MCGTDLTAPLRYELSDWCKPCVRDTLAEQERDEREPVMHEVFER